MKEILINKLQIGDQIYRLSPTTHNQIERGNNYVIRVNSISYTVVRANTISSIKTSDDICVIGLPHEYMQESGNLVLLCDNFGILNENSSDIEGYPYKFTVLQNYISDDIDSWLYPNLDDLFKFKVSIFWNEDNINNYCIRKCTLDGNIIEEQIVSDGSLVLDIKNLIQEYENMCIYIQDDTVHIKLYEQIGDDMVDLNIYGGYGYEDSISLPISTESNQQSKTFIYFGNAYMNVSSVNHYMFNIITNQGNSFISNIPINWSQDIVPDFDFNKFVQISILDGVGTFNTVNLET